VDFYLIISTGSFQTGMAEKPDVDRRNEGLEEGGKFRRNPGGMNQKNG